MPGVSGRLLASGCVIGITLAASSAKADVGTIRLSVDWGKTVGQGMALLAGQSEHSREAVPRTNEIAVGASQTPEIGSAWFGVAPRVSFVARDWGSARSLAGGPIAVTDAIRVSRSCRMAMSRLRLGEGRFVPFTQFGLGQWRVDTDMVPHLPRNVELAAQVGAGIEVHVARGWEIAAETDLTVLYREVHEPQQLNSPRMWGTFLASRFEF